MKLSIRATSLRSNPSHFNKSKETCPQLGARFASISRSNSVTSSLFRQSRAQVENTNGEIYSLGGLDGGRGAHDHEYTVNQYRSDDEEGKERVNQYVNGHTSYRVERVEDPHRVRR